MRQIGTGLQNWDNRELVICTDGNAGEWWVAALREDGKYIGACSASFRTRVAALEAAREIQREGNQTSSREEQAA
jgi:hypothetical protein